MFSTTNSNNTDNPPAIATSSNWCFGLFAALIFPAFLLAGPLTDAALTGDVAAVEELLEGGADIEEPGIAGPLYFASQRGHTDVVKLLVNRGADVNRMSKFGTALNTAARKKHVDIVKFLLENGADVTVRSENDQFTPLHEAALGGSVEVIQLLLDHGAEVNALAYDNEPPIHLAKENRKEEAAALLLENGASPPELEPISGLLASADLEKGKLRSYACTTCHTIESDKQSSGGAPNLWDVVGRPRASLQFPYSDALKAKGGVWGFEELSQFIYNPTLAVPGTKMFLGFEPDQQTRVNLIAYLRMQSDEPIPLP